MNYRGILAIYKFEMSRTFRTVGQSIASPVISTVLYFIVFGSAIGSHMNDIDGVKYGAFIVPGLMMLTMLSQSIANASFGIYFPRFTGTIYEILSAPLSFAEVAIGYVGGAATKSLIIGVIVLITSSFFVPLEIRHPLWMVFFLVMTCVTFSLLGFIIGIWADGFEKLQLIPLLIITPLTFLGGSFYSIKMLPEFWQSVSFLNPVVYLVSGFRWSFYESSDVSHMISVVMIMVFLAICTCIVAWIFKTGYRLRN
jgi:ABC-2 type transport system permease protein